MSETGYIPEFKLGTAVVRRSDFLNWATGIGPYRTWTVEAITISANKTTYHTSGGGTYEASDLIPAEAIIMLGIKHLQARQTALIEMLKAKGDTEDGADLEAEAATPSAWPRR